MASRCSLYMQPMYMPVASAAAVPPAACSASCSCSSRMRDCGSMVAASPGARRKAAASNASTPSTQ